jgi:hypothetical protein
MSIPRRYAPILFGGLLSAIMVAVVTAVVLLVNQGLAADFASRWLRSFVTTWPVAFPTVTLVAPLVRRFVDKVTAQ